MTKITVKEFFQGMENLYDANFATTFLVTEDFSQADTSAQRVWIKNLVDSWRTKIIQESGLLITEMKLNTSKDDERYFMGKFTFVAPGSLNHNLGILPDMEEGIKNLIKKNLARKVLKEYPLFSVSSIERRKINFAAMIPVYILLGRIGESEFNKDTIKRLQENSWKQKAQNVLSNYEAELLEGPCILDKNITNSPVSIKIQFKKVVSKSDINSLLICLAQNFSGLVEWVSPELITLSNFSHYIL